MHGANPLLVAYNRGFRAHGKVGTVYGIGVTVVRSEPIHAAGTWLLASTASHACSCKDRPTNLVCMTEWNRQHAPICKGEDCSDEPSIHQAPAKTSLPILARSSAE